MDVVLNSKKSAINLNLKTVKLIIIINNKENKTQLTVIKLKNKNKKSDICIKNLGVGNLSTLSKFKSEHFNK